MTSFPLDLRRHRILVVASSLLLAGAGVLAVALAFSPDSGVASPIPFVAFAAIAFTASGFGAFFVPWWYRRAAYVLSHIPPISGTATLTLEEDSESTSLYAAVSVANGSTSPILRVALLLPRWDVRPLCGPPQSVRLHVDPSNSRLMAVSTSSGALWCMPMGHVIRHQTAV